MAKKETKKKASTASTGVTKGTKGSPKKGNRKKPRKKLFKPKKGKNLIKGLASVAINAGIQKGMTSAFEGRVKEKDFQKKNAEGKLELDVKAYSEAVEKQKTIHGAANIGLWLIGAGNSLPKDYISSEYLEINALERGVNTFIGKSKNDKVKKAATYFQGEDMSPETYVLEAADLIEAAELEEAFIENYEENEENEVAFLEESSSNNEDEVVFVTEKIEGFQGFEGMNNPIPGIEEEN